MTYNELVAVLGKYAQSQYPFEACGIITKDFNFIPSDNLSNKPKSSFIIDPVLLVENDDNIWGIFHSHPDEKYSEPSESDLKMIIDIFGPRFSILDLRIRLQGGNFA